MRDYQREFKRHGNDVGDTDDIEDMDDGGGLGEPPSTDGEAEEVTPADFDLLTQCRASLRTEGVRSTAAAALFHRFVDQWWGYVERIASRKPGIRSWEDRQDLTNRVFLRAWDWLKSQSGLAKPATMLQRCLDLAYVDLVREKYGRQKSKDKAPATAETEFGATGSQQHEQQAKEIALKPGTDPRFPMSLEAAIEVENGDLQSLMEQLPGKWDVESTVLRWELRSELRAAIATLPRNYRDCVECRYLDELSVRETAERLGISDYVVEHNTARGLALLRPKLRREE